MDISEITKRLEAISFKNFSLNEEHSEHPYVSVQDWEECKSSTDQLKLLDGLGEKKFEKMKNKYTLKVNLKLGTFKFFDEVRIVVIGKTGVGKSTTANTILGKDLFGEAASSSSVTSQSRRRENKVNGRLIKVIDTPGLHDTHKSKEEITQEIARVMKLFPDGIHAFIYVQDISNPRFTQENKETLEAIEELFGGGIKDFRLLVYSKADTLSTLSLDNFRDVQMGDGSQAIEHFLKDLDWRVVAVNNKTTIPAEKKRNQEVIIAMVDKLRQQNDNAVYTNEMFQEAVEKRKELEEKGKKMGWNTAVMEAVEAVLAADPDVVKDKQKFTVSIQNHLKRKIEETERELKEARRKEEEDEIRIAEQRERARVLTEEIQQEQEQKCMQWQKQQEERRCREEHMKIEQDRARKEQEWIQRQKQQEIEWQQAFEREREKRRRREQEKPRREAKAKQKREKREKELEKSNQKGPEEKQKKEETVRPEKPKRGLLKVESNEGEREDQIARVQAAQLAEREQRLKQAEAEKKERERQRREHIEKKWQEQTEAEMEEARLRVQRQEELPEERKRSQLEREKLIAEIKQLQVTKEALNNNSMEREANEIASEHDGILNSMVGVVKSVWTNVKIFLNLA